MLYRSAHMSPRSRKYSRLVSILLILATPCFASPDGGTWDVELLDAGTVLPTQMAVMSPSDAQSLDVYLRTTEHERDAYKGWLLVVTPIAVVATVAAGVLAVGLATKR